MELRVLLLYLAQFLLVFTCISAKSTGSDKPLYPIVLVPGDGGSQFEAKLNKPVVRHIWCEKKTDYWFSLWLNLELLAPYILDCTVDNLRLEYDRVTRTTKNAPGVLTRQPGFGNTSSVEWLDPSQFSPTSYFYPIVQALVSVGYVRNQNIRGAPYDFRKAPNEMKEFLSNLKNLIEDTYTINGKLPVHLLGHSMGNTFILYLLHHQTQAWKDKYIRSHIALAGPWAGAAKTLRLMASGDNLGVFVVNPLSARPEQRSMPSTAWLLPYADIWGKDEILVSGPKGNYTVNDYERFFNDVNYPEGWLMRQDTVNLMQPLVAPGVAVHCMHGINVTTPASFLYSNKTWYDYQPTVVNSNGDGTVNERSLLTCLRWADKQKQPIHHKTFDKVDHMSILGNKDVIQHIKDIVTNKDGLY